MSFVRPNVMLSGNRIKHPLARSSFVMPSGSTPVVPWTPASLTNLDFWYEINATSCWKDAAKTQQAGNGDTVWVVSGMNGSPDLVMATGVRQYTLVSSGGKWYLDPGAGNHWMATATNVDSFRSKRGILWAAVDTTTVQSSDNVIMATYSQATPDWEWMYTGAPKLEFYDGVSTRSYDTSMPALGKMRIAFVRTGDTTFDGYRNNVQTDTGLTLSNNQPAANPLWIGSSSAISERGAAKIYALVGASAVPSASDFTNLETYGSGLMV